MRGYSFPNPPIFFFIFISMKDFHFMSNFGKFLFILIFKLFSFVCLSVYLHFVVFLFGFWIIEKFTNQVLDKKFHYLFLTSKRLHTLVALIMALWLTIMGFYVTQTDPIVIF